MDLVAPLESFPRGANVTPRLTAVIQPKVRKIGNSLGFVLPNELVRALHTTEGVEVNPSAWMLERDALVRSHPFIAGTKRVGFVVGLAFLELRR